eukprot:gene25986-11675_t
MVGDSALIITYFNTGFAVNNVQIPGSIVATSDMYFNTGFAVNNVQIPGSIVATSDMYLMWKPRRMEEVTPDSLVFLELLNPRPERNATGYFNVLNDDGRVVVGALLAMDPNAALPEVMPEIKNPVIDAGLSKTNKVV